MLKSFLKIIYLGFILISFILLGCSENTKQEKTKITSGQEEAYTCVFESENSPKISLEAEKKYNELELMYSEIHGTYDFSDPKVHEEEAIKNLLILLEENKETNWKIKYHLGVLYTVGLFGEKNKEKGPLYFKQLVKADVPAGYFGMSLSLPLGDPKEKYENLEKAAKLGSPLAQYYLGRQALYRIQEAEAPEEAQNDYNIAFNNIICALRQGSSDSAYIVADYLNNEEENYVLAMQYYWQAAILGNEKASLFLYNTFISDISNASEFDAEIISKNNFLPLKGYEKNDELAKKIEDTFHLFFSYKGLYPVGSQQKTIDFSGIEIPNNTLMTREEALKKDSKIKEVFEGQWPHELYSLF